MPRKLKTLEQVRTEVAREMDQRARVYPRLIQSQKLHRDRANHQQLCLLDLLHVLESMTPAEWAALQERWRRRQADGAGQGVLPLLP